MEVPTKPILVGIIMGSDSDETVAVKAREVLERLQVPFAATICSAHRTPDDLRGVINSWSARGCRIFIAIAGMAAHLAGVIASYTVRPVIAVPLASKDGSAVSGLDALLACVQMPPGIPVATVAINGAANAAHLAVQILALIPDQAHLDERLREFRAGLVETTRAKAAQLAERGWPQ